MIYDLQELQKKKKKRKRKKKGTTNSLNSVLTLSLALLPILQGHVSSTIKKCHHKSFKSPQNIVMIMNWC